MIVSYLAKLPYSKLVLWCYLCWYLSMVAMYFNASAEIWLNSLGLCLLVGYALFLSTGPGTMARLRERFWESLRLFMCPFLVSSFSSLVKGKGFILLFSPVLADNLMALSACGCFVLLAQLAKWRYGRQGNVQP